MEAKLAAMSKSQVPGTNVTNMSGQFKPVQTPQRPEPQKVTVATEDVTIVKAIPGNIKPQAPLHKTPVKKPPPVRQTTPKQSPQSASKTTPHKQALRSPQTPGGKGTFIDNLIATGVPIVIPDDDDDPPKKTSMPKPRSNIFDLKSQQYRSRKSLAGYERGLPVQDTQTLGYETVTNFPQGSLQHLPQQEAYNQQQQGMYTPTKTYAQPSFTSPTHANLQSHDYNPESFKSPPRMNVQNPQGYISPKEQRIITKAMAQATQEVAQQRELTMRQESLARMQYESDLSYTELRTTNRPADTSFMSGRPMAYTEAQTPPKQLPQQGSRKAFASRALSPQGVSPTSTRMAVPRLPQQVSQVRRNIAAPRQKLVDSGTTIVIDDDAPPPQSVQSKPPQRLQAPPQRLQAPPQRLQPPPQRLQAPPQRVQAPSQRVQAPTARLVPIQRVPPASLPSSSSSDLPDLATMLKVKGPIITQGRPIASQDNPAQTLPVIASVTSMAVESPSGHPAVVPQQMTLPVTVNPHYVPPPSAQDIPIQSANERTPVKRARTEDATDDSKKEEPAQKRRTSATVPQATVTSTEEVLVTVKSETVAEGIKTEPSRDTDDSNAAQTKPNSGPVESPSKIRPQLEIDIDVEDSAAYNRQLNAANKASSTTESESKASTSSTVSSTSSRRKSNSGDRFACGECDKTYSTKGALRVHFKKHTVGEPFVCDMCTKHFSEKSTLKKHIYEHFKEKE